MYKKLRIIKYDDLEKFNSIYNSRYIAESSLKLGLKISPFSKNEKIRIKDKTFPLFINLIPEINFNSEKIIRNSIKLNSILEKMPILMKKNIYRSQIIEEIQGTNDIENVNSTRKEISELMVTSSKNRNSRLIGSINMYSNLILCENLKIMRLEDFRNIYDKLFIEDIHKNDLPDGKLFRAKNVYVSSKGKIVHQGSLSESQINSELLDLISFMNRKDISILIKAIISHFYFEYVHPFYDGNGRMGRFILSSYLTSKLDILTGLSFSQAARDNKRLYEDSFVELSHPYNMGEATHFLIDLLNIILHGQNNIISKIYEFNNKLSLANEYLTKNNLNKDYRDILIIYFQNIFFDEFDVNISNIEICELYDGKISRQKIDKITRSLFDMGYLDLIKQRPLTYKLKNNLTFI